MNNSRLNALRAFLEAVKIISDDFIEVSMYKLIQESFEYKGVGGHICEGGMNLIPDINHNISSDDIIFLLGDYDDDYCDSIAALFVEYIDDEDKYEDEYSRPFFIRRMLTGNCLLEPYEFDNTEKYEHDNRAAEVKNKYK